MKRTLVISDIHGELELFEELLQVVEYDSNKDQLILLGDYIDRGPNSKGVLEKVIQLKNDGAIVLKGNHEDMMVKSFTTNEERTWKNWTNRNGGKQTLLSYGFSEEEFIVKEEDPFIKPILQSEIVDKHLQFIQNLDYYVEWEDTIFVHAGVHPEKKIEETDPYELIWIRDVFHNGYCGEKTVIFGHTPTKNLHNNKQDYSVFYGDNRIIGIDGAAVYGGQLNCLQLPERIVYSVKGREVTKEGQDKKSYKALLPERIFFGSVNAIDELMKEQKIDIIYDLRAKVNGDLPSEISVHQPLLDDEEAQDHSIREAVKKVVDAYNDGKNIYFHCNTGRGRGGTLAAATLLELGKAHSVEEAEALTKEIRPETAIQPSFKAALKRLYDSENRETQNQNNKFD